ncbi:MAG: ECF RNA polymerase sigma factor RpoE [Alphaproteobacteria bacterium MarineAlpha2_Bin1]|mgnify:CR=1 FL=1|nr:MAG: ECF RNA polymerase sigma factor RpoE [Alphaproteobacteria bacterium MarineAlpha2_Bin1]
MFFYSFNTHTKLPVYKCTDKTYAPNMKNDVLEDNDVIQDYSYLIDEIANNQNKQAFIKLFKHFAPRIKTFIKKTGLSLNEAEDLAQETMITVWNKAKLFKKDKSAASTWIFAIARNKRIDHLRKQKHPIPHTEDLLNESDLNINNHDLIIEKEQMFTYIKSEISKLPLEQAIVLKKSFFEGMSHIQISKDLSIPLGTVKSRIRLALTSIRKKMKGLH